MSHVLFFYKNPENYSVRFSSIIEQHRHFLETESRQSHGGPVATGLCPADRYRQMQSHRFVKAAYDSADYRVARILAEISTEKSLSVQSYQSSNRQNKVSQLGLFENLDFMWDENPSMFSHPVVDAESLSITVQMVLLFSHHGRGYQT